MLIQTILDTLNRLKLYGFAAALGEQSTQSAASSLACEERLGLLVDREVLYRDNQRLTRLLRLAQLKHRNACVAGHRLPRPPRTRPQSTREPCQL